MGGEDICDSVGHARDAIEGQKRMPHKFTGRLLGESRDAVQREFSCSVCRQDRGHRRRDVLDIVHKKSGEAGDAPWTLLTREDRRSALIQRCESAE